MGYAARNNPTAIAAKNGEIPPKKKMLGKRATKQILAAFIAEKINDERIAPLLNLCEPYGSEK